MSGSSDIENNRRVLIRLYLPLLIIQSLTSCLVIYLQNDILNGRYFFLPIVISFLIFFISFFFYRLIFKISSNVITWHRTIATCAIILSVFIPTFLYAFLLYLLARSYKRTVATSLISSLLIFLLVSIGNWQLNTKPELNLLENSNSFIQTAYFNIDPLVRYFLEADQGVFKIIKFDSLCEYAPNPLSCYSVYIESYYESNSFHYYQLYALAAVNFTLSSYYLNKKSASYDNSRKFTGTYKVLNMLLEDAIESKPSQLNRYGFNIFLPNSIGISIVTVINLYYKDKFFETGLKQVSRFLNEDSSFSVSNEDIKKGVLYLKKLKDF